MMLGKRPGGNRREPDPSRVLALGIADTAAAGHNDRAILRDCSGAGGWHSADGPGLVVAGEAAIALSAVTVRTQIEHRTTFAAQARRTNPPCPSMRHRRRGRTTAMVSWHFGTSLVW